MGIPAKHANHAKEGPDELQPVRIGTVGLVRERGRVPKPPPGAFFRVVSVFSGSCRALMAQRHVLAKIARRYDGHGKAGYSGSSGSAWGG